MEGNVSKPEQARQIQLLSIIAPVYNEAIGIRHFIEEVAGICDAAGLNYEIVLIDDGSTDDTWSAIQELASQSNKTKILAAKFSKNYGKEAAILAGLSEASGDAFLLIDSDLQHPPAVIPEFIEAYEAHADVVIGRKTSRPDQSGFTRFGASVWSKLFQAVTKIDVRNTTDFRLISPKVKELILRTSSSRSFFRFESSSFGFEQAFVDFDPSPRQHGSTKFNFLKLARLASNSVTASSTRPLHLVSLLAALTIFAGLVLSIQTFVNWLNGNAASGFTTVILLLLLIGGVQMLALGIIGEYIGELVGINRRRPIFVIERTIRSGR